MNYKNRHFHSIVVHSVVAFSLLAFFSSIFYKTDTAFLMMSTSEWKFLTIFSLFFLLLLAVPATISGIAETNKMYPKWHNTHKIKLFLSLILIILAFFLLCLDFQNVQFSIFFSFLILIVVFFLSFYGLKITLGRQSLARTSYVPDFFNKTNKKDIIDEAEKYIKEKPKRLDYFDLGEE